MSGIGRGILAGLALATIGASQAVAGTWAGNGTYCGGNTFTTCINVSLSWTNGSGTSTVVTMVMKNETPLVGGFAGLKWFSVGLDNLPAGLTYSGSGDLGFVDSQTTGFSGGPFTATIYAQGNNGGASPGFDVARTFTFNFSAASSQNWDALLQAAGAGLHAGGVTINDTNCSTKIVVRDNLAAGAAYGANGPDGSSPNCETGSPPTEITPEPASIALMATGLVGLAGAGFIKRRRNEV